MPVLRISQQLYNRLEKHADGFDSPAQVIERVLNHFEEVPNTPKSDSNLVNKPKPLLTFEPNETQFHLSLVEGMEANIVIRYLDGSESNKTWRPTRYTQGSNLRGNIWSGFLRGWKDQDIISAKFCAGNEPTQ